MPQDNKDIDHVYKVIDKLDLAIDKLADVSSDIKQILAVHETRLDQSEAIMDRHFVQMDGIHQRIGNLRDDMNKESEEIRKELFNNYIADGKKNWEKNKSHFKGSYIANDMTICSKLTEEN